MTQIPANSIPNPAQSPPAADDAEYTAPAVPEFDLAPALTRIIVGLGVEGQRELLKRIQTWEEIAHSANDPLAVEANEIDASELRYALIGYLFETQQQLGRGANKLLDLLDVSTRLTITSLNLVAITLLPVRRLVTRNRYVQPRLSHANRQFDYLVARGEREVRRWQARGQLEDLPSRAIARHVVLDSVDEFIDYLSKNEQIAQLVQEQSIGLAGEIATEVREYSVSADNALEALVRRLLRRPPRPTVMTVNPGQIIENEMD